MIILQLNLPEGVSIDVIVSSVVAPNHLFIQQPTHPTFPMLERMNQCMNICYMQDSIVPELPRPIESKNSIAITIVMNQVQFTFYD